MNRRNFLKSIGKICAVLPFVGSSSAVGDSGVSEGQPKAPMCATEVAERYGTSPTAGTLPEVKKFNKGLTYQNKGLTYQQAEALLKAEWGDKYDENIAIAQNTARNLGGETFQKYLDDTGLGNELDVIRGFYDIGKKNQSNFPFIMDWGKDKYKIDLV